MMIQDENIHSVKAIEPTIPAITNVCNIITERMRNGGRLIYVGAGTSGRLGVMDAVECPPTYGVPDGIVLGVIAGGSECMFRASESEEDSGESGINDLKALQLCDCDSIVGISASGNAAYVAEALAYARSNRCFTVGLTCNPGSRLDQESDIAIVTDTGAEVITGSTRMKAGTAHKMVLTMISTCVMVKLGKVYENFMINLKPTNQKLKKRIIGIVCEICGIDENLAEELLQTHNYNIRQTIEDYNNRIRMEKNNG